MREILFRGKRVDNGEWAESPYPYGTMSGGVVQHDFISETIGQFTGLTDKNGVKIFEGDIVKYGNTLHEVVFCDFADNVYFGIWFADRGKIWAFSPSVAANRMTVIGNIHDSPELIEDMDIKPAAKMSDTPAEQLGLAPAT